MNTNHKFCLEIKIGLHKKAVSLMGPSVGAIEHEIP